jgi:hypothetical protein
VSLRRSGNFTPLVRSTENTAAASVEPTMLPSSSPCGNGNCNTQAAVRPVSTEVINTPTVESARVGRHTDLTASREVRRPPSKRIKAMAALPALLARA